MQIGAVEESAQRRQSVYASSSQTTSRIAALKLRRTRFVLTV